MNKTRVSGIGIILIIATILVAPSVQTSLAHGTDASTPLRGEHK